MPRRHSSSARALGVGVRLVKKPEALEPGKVRCLCSAVVSLTPNGRIRAHQTPKGDDCAHRAVYAKPVHLAELPPVVMPRASRPPKSTRVATSKPDASRLDVGSHCETEGCGKWLPGERQFCGQCARKRDAERRGR